jgi:hypothetical protein
MPPCKSLLGQLSTQPHGVRGMPDYDEDDNCMTYLAHPPVLLPVVSASTLGEDNDHRDGIIASGGHLGEGSAGQLQSQGNRQLSQPLHLLARMGDTTALLWCVEWTFSMVYHPKYRILTPYFMCLRPDGVIVCWDKVLQWLRRCFRHLVSHDCGCIKGGDKGYITQRITPIISTIISKGLGVGAKPF